MVPSEPETLEIIAIFKSISLEGNQLCIGFSTLLYQRVHAQKRPPSNGVNERSLPKLRADEQQRSIENIVFFSRLCLARRAAGSAVLLVEALLHDDGSGPLTVQLYSLNMLVQTEGRERTAAQYAALLAAAGFANIQHRLTGKIYDAVLGHKVALACETKPLQWREVWFGAIHRNNFVICGPLESYSVIASAATSSSTPSFSKKKKNVFEFCHTDKLYWLEKLYCEIALIKFLLHLNVPLHLSPQHAQNRQCINWLH